MEKYKFVFFSGAIGFTAPHIGEVRKEIARRVDKEKVESVKHDIELQMIENKNGIPAVMYSCYLYNDSFELMHGSISKTKDYMKEAWRYLQNRNNLSKLTIMNNAETLKKELLKKAKTNPYNNLMLQNVLERFRKGENPVCITQIPPRISDAHICIENGRYYSQKKEEPYKFNYPYDKYIRDRDVTDESRTHGYWYDAADKMQKVLFLKEQGFCVIEHWVCGMGEVIEIYLK